MENLRQKMRDIANKVQSEKSAQQVERFKNFFKINFDDILGQIETQAMEGKYSLSLQIRIDKQAFFLACGTDIEISSAYLIALEESGFQQFDCCVKECGPSTISDITEFEIMIFWNI